MAILETINQANKHNIINFTIFSDSKSVLTALQNISCNNKSSHLLLEIRHQIKLINESNGSVKLVWIPSHCGIKGNEMADALAKEAPKFGIDYPINTSIRDFKATWKNELFKSFSKWCKGKNNKNKASCYMENYWTDNRSPWFDQFNISRKGITSICRMRCGHTSLNESFSKILHSAFLEMSQL
ncbi:uncharacterized protein LOC112637311 [Camponotus floridanus]|uniref:uncharacterized protein LOC112637311 n=1 Tax=Camponotus floridanus TaxID=104421 RepID=UPI000DC6821E|nr:uncharacterized protein LOC112637311 [Camponotus floridanus]